MIETAWHDVKRPHVVTTLKRMSAEQVVKEWDRAVRHDPSLKKRYQLNAMVERIRTALNSSLRSRCF